MSTDTDIRPPTRFRSGEERGARIGRVLKAVGRVRTVDEELLDLIGRRFMERDEIGAALVQAMRSKTPDRPTMRQFQQALVAGINSVDDAPPALRDFFATVDTVPDWVDFDLLNRGALAYRRCGKNAADVLLQLSLLGGYRFGGPTDLLVATGALTGDMTMRRLGETQKWGVAVSEHDAMRRGGEGFQLTVHVRLMHAMVNHRFESGDRWDTAMWGLPINRTDQAATLGLFNGALLLGVRALGVRMTAADSLAIMHLWKYIGWLMGVDEDWLFDTEREQHRFNYHVLLAQGDVTPAGAQLANGIMDAQKTLHFARFPRLGRAYARARLLSMLRPFLGKEGMRDLGLPVRRPWATLGIIPNNLLRYHVLGRTGWGERSLHRRAEKARDTVMFRYFGPDQPEIGKIPQA
ncbi:oxygenase MpaB family protein [Aeromicrobium sp.]|uniref:oxygenase MpaB family protein n=1 Tax=Aeromicrobium sp. TaxID=1871063 RepID=UPI0030C008E2